ncbi:MAG: hypothetical protein V1875_06860 [Candidatus Altiarchaeota archaeon]
MKALAAVILVILALGCMSPKECPKPYIQSGSVCCLDENQNGACDDTEIERLVLVVNSTGLKTDEVTTTTVPEKPAVQIPRNASEESIRQTPDDSSGQQPGTGTDDSSEPQEPLMNVSFFGFIPVNVSSGGGNSSFCSESTLQLSNTKQDGHIGDESEPLDGAGEKVVTGGYILVGDVADKRNLSNDDPYRGIIALPVGGLGDFSDARLNVLPYATQGTSLDTYVEHVPCSGSVEPADYGFATNGTPTVLIKAKDSNEMFYGIGITEYVKADIGAGRQFSCYRLSWDREGLAKLNNKKTDARFIFGFGSSYAPYMSYIQRPCVRCNVNSDCGNTSYVTGYQCMDGKILRQFVHSRCADPLSDAARCVMTQEVQDFATCRIGESCVDGEDECFSAECYNGENDTNEVGVDCGGPCRPCHCFDRKRDMIYESGLDCGGECKPCVEDKRLPFIRLTNPVSGRLFGSTIVPLAYSVNKQGVGCWFEVNGVEGGSLQGNRLFRAQEGSNNLTVFCMDSFGRSANASASFKVESKRFLSCENDSTVGVYRQHFDGASFFRDRSGRDWAGSCGEAFFNSSMAVADSAPHALGPVDVALGLGDGALGDYRYAGLSYSCDERMGYDVGYAALAKEGVDRKAKFRVALFFQEVKAPQQGYDYAYNEPAGNLSIWFRNLREELERNPLATNQSFNASASNRSNVVISSGNESRQPPSNSFWRVYRYAADGDAVDKSSYLDFQYAPKESGCNAGSGLRYQELDLTPLIANGTGNRAELRLALYSRKAEALVGIVEAEISYK